MSDLLYQKLGINPEQLKDLTEEKATEIVVGLQNNLKTQLLESPEFYETLDEAKLTNFKNKYLKEGESKIYGIAKKELEKQFGLTEEDKKQFSEDDYKNLDKFIDKVKSVFSQKINTGNKDVNALQDENISLKQQLSEYDTKLNSLQEKFESDVAEKLTQKEIETLTLIEVSKLTNNLVGQVGATFKLVYPQIQSKYAIIVDGGVPSLRKKDNPAFKVEIDNNGKKEHLTIEKAIELEYKALGLWKETQQQQQAQQTITVNGDFSGQNRQMPEHLKRKIADEKNFLNA